jgi:hypothetical protein
MHVVNTRLEAQERAEAMTASASANCIKWTLRLHQSLVRDVVSLITSDTPSLKEVGILLRRTEVWGRVFKSPFGPPREWTDMHPPLVLEMLEAAGKLGRVISVHHALIELADAEQWQQCSPDELDYHYHLYIWQRDSNLSHYYTPYSYSM